MKKFFTLLSMLLTFVVGSFAEGKTIYLDADQWQPNDGHFAVWAWEGDEFDITKGSWIPLEYVEGELAVYKATLPQGCTHVNFARFIKATPVGGYAWEKGEDVDNRPYHCTQDITLQDDVDRYRITAMGVLYRNTGTRAANIEAAGLFSPREWNWQEYTVTFKTNKSWEKVYAVVWSGTSESGNNYTNLTATTLDGKNIARVKAPGRLIEQSDGVYTFTFKAEAAPEYIRFGDGKGSKDATFARTTDNLPFENGKLYELYDPKTIYLDADQWQPNDGHFAVWAWEGDEFDITKGSWIPLEYVEGELAVYKATLPQGCTHVNFARFIKATPVGGYAWEKGEDVDNRPYHCTQDITLQDDVDRYRITAMGVLYRNTGTRAANIEAAGLFSPREWNWQEFTVTFKTNKSWEKVYAVVWSGTSETGNNYTNLTATTLDGKNIARVKAPGRLIEQSDGVYTFTFKAEAAPEYIRFGDGKGSKDATFARTTDNLAFENGKLYELYDPEYYLVGSMNDWSINEQYKLEANPEANGEYMITLDLAAGAELKIKSNTDVWYPDGVGNNYVVEKAGKYTIYFRPDGSGGDDWHYHFIYVQEEAGSSEPKTIYLDADQWQPNDGHFAVWAWEGDEFDITKGSWIPLEYVEGELAVYKATLPQGCTHVNFARFIKATPVGEYAWEKNGDVDNRPYHCTQDITLQDDVDRYRITAMGVLYRNTGTRAANIEAAGLFSPREWNWQEFTVTFKTNKSWEKVYAVVWSGTSETGNNYTNLTATTLDEKNIARVKAPGRLLELSEGVYTFTFKAEAAPEYIRFGDGKGSKDNTFARTTDNLPFENGKLYELYDPEYYLVGSMNDWSINEQYKLEANPGAEGEYMITLSLEAGAELKVRGIDGTWYPDNAPNYKVEQAGNYTVYFRPDGSGGDDWHYHVIYVTGTSGIFSIKAALEKGAVIYTLQGKRVTEVRKGNIYIMNGKKILVK